jgi:hypothetical protein
MNSLRKSFWFASALSIATLISGCETKSKARTQAQEAFLAGQNSVLRQEQQQQQQASTVTVIGPVQRPQVPWVVGLTLAQAITTANYIDSKPPKEIIITRNGEDAKIDPNVLLRGTDVPLEAGDVIRLR